MDRSDPLERILPPRAPCHNRFQTQAGPVIAWPVGRERQETYATGRSRRPRPSSKAAESTRPLCTRGTGGTATRGSSLLGLIARTAHTAPKTVGSLRRNVPSVVAAGSWAKLGASSGVAGQGGIQNSMEPVPEGSYAPAAHRPQRPRYRTAPTDGSRLTPAWWHGSNRTLRRWPRRGVTAGVAAVPRRAAVTVRCGAARVAFPSRSGQLRHRTSSLHRRFRGPGCSTTAVSCPTRNGG